MTADKVTKVELPPIDPTKNVMDLVALHTKRLDDLREAEARRADDIRRVEIRRLEEVFHLRDAIRKCEHEHTNEIMDMKAQHSIDLAAREKERLDAIRVIDGNNLTAAVERTQAEAKLLAKSVEHQAEERRIQLAELASQFFERIGKLETYQNELRGRQGLSTPLVAVLAAIIGAFLGFGIQFIANTISHIKGGG